MKHYYDAVFIIAGTPLLKKDKATSGSLVATSIPEFGEAVEDEVVLDPVYEARDIDQRLARRQRWTNGLIPRCRANPWQQRELKRQWGTLQNVLSSKSRMNRIVADIVFDFSVRQRLASQCGNAILVASSIYEACKYFELFNETELKGKCAVVTSYDPKAADVTKEEVGANTETDKQFIYNTYTKLLEDISPQPGMTRTEAYEEQAKQCFIRTPAHEAVDSGRQASYWLRCPNVHRPVYR